MVRLRQPLKRRGPRTERWAAWHDASRRAVMVRAGWSCEGCGTTMRPLEWAHLVGRNNKGIGEPWCSTPELTAALCSGNWGEMGCHEKIDRALEPELLNRLRLNACGLLASRYGIGGPVIGSDLGDIRNVVALAEAAGWQWDAELGQVVMA